MKQPKFFSVNPDSVLEGEQALEPEMFADVARAGAASPVPTPDVDIDALPIQAVLATGLQALCGSVCAAGMLSVLLLLAARTKREAMEMMAQLML